MSGQRKVLNELVSDIKRGERIRNFVLTELYLKPLLSYHTKKDYDKACLEVGLAVIKRTRYDSEMFQSCVRSDRENIKKTLSILYPYRLSPIGGSTRDGKKKQNNFPGANERDYEKKNAEDYCRRVGKCIVDQYIKNNSNPVDLCCSYSYREGGGCAIL
jgi:hypothetical protein